MHAHITSGDNHSMSEHGERVRTSQSLEVGGLLWVEGREAKGWGMHAWQAAAS